MGTQKDLLYQEAKQTLNINEEARGKTNKYGVNSW